jgi:hypothetical protein
MIGMSIGKAATFTALLLAVGVVLGSGVSNTTTNHNVDAQIMSGNNTGIIIKP